MVVPDFPQEKIKKFEIEAYKRPRSSKDLRKTHVSFSGSPMKHPFDAKKVILIMDPYSRKTSYYEFRSQDISYVEELPSIVDMDGKTITMVRIWVKKMSVALLCSLFLVGETKR
jgi:inorganic pyrophosphatase